jgi:hypothetical protein
MPADEDFIRAPSKVNGLRPSLGHHSDPTYWFAGGAGETLAHM